MSKRILFLMFCLSQFLAACSASKQQQPFGAAALAVFQECETAADCVYAQNGCCDCANGGEAVAVSKSKLEDFQDEFDCDGIACTLIAAQPPCNVGTLSCEDSLCKFTRP